MPEESSPAGAPAPSPRRNRLLGWAWDDRSPNFRGAVCVVFGEILLVFMAALAKELGSRIHAFEIVFVRFLAGFLAILPVVWRSGGFARMRTRTLPLHMIRSVVGTIANLSLFWSVIHLTLADAITIQFSRPLIMVVIAVVVLREVVGLGRAVATAVGFAGVLMVARPFGEGFDPWYLVAFNGAFFSALVILSVKLLSRSEPTLVIMFYFSLFTSVFSFIPALFVWETPTGWDLLLLVLAGVCGLLGQGIFTHGIGLGETSFLMPFDYLRIVYSFLIGILWFAEIPQPWSIAGAVVIFASSLYLLRTESRPNTPG